MPMLRDKMNAVLAELNTLIAEREELLSMLAIALLTRKNVFILGDTGQAKSQAIDELRRRITGARQFERLLSKQADEEQLFGRIDLSSMIPGNPDPRALAGDTAYQRLHAQLEQAYAAGDFSAIEACTHQLEVCRKALYALHGNNPRVNTAGKIPDSHIVFLDEVFKAGDGILNSLLKAINERRYTNEGESVDIPTISFFTASNEIPNFHSGEGSILTALYDRLEIKVHTKYIEGRDNRLRILKNKQAGSSGPLQNIITLDELCAMQREVAAVIVPDAVNELMDTILCELRDKMIHISDRKYFGYYPLAQAHAWLQGRDAVSAQDLLVLKHYLWTDPGELDIIEGLLVRKCVNPLQDMLDDITRRGLECYDDFEASDSAAPVKRVGKLRGELTHLYGELQALEAKAQSNEEKALIGDTLVELEKHSAKAHQATGLTYTPLPELYAMQRMTA